MLRQVRSTSIFQCFAQAVVLSLAAVTVVAAGCMAASAGTLSTPAAMGSRPTLSLFSSSLTGATPPPAATAADVSKSTPLPGAQDKDWAGVSRDTAVFVGAQFVAVGVIYLMPESVSGWSREQKSESIEKYEENVGHPAMDKDKFYINYVLHPYWGATYYIRARERGLSKGESFLYSTLISSMYEFGVEAFFERPSIQDLVVTPIAGSLLGAYLFEPLRESIRGKKESRWYYDAILVATDPVGVLGSGIERVFGIKSAARLDYALLQLQRLSAGTAMTSRNSHIGVVVEFPLK